LEEWIDLTDEIVDWLRKYAQKNNISTFVVGVSGGIDSAVTSTLCAKTKLDTIVVNMPIHQENSQLELSDRHIEWLLSDWKNVRIRKIDLSEVFDLFTNEEVIGEGLSDLVLANTRARLRMAALYSVAGSNNGIVVGTGNKIEDFGIGFFTKYGDGGVDISPIADLYKSDVYAIADSLGIIREIRDAPPTDGLWDDGRTDEDQIGATYLELEWAMKENERGFVEDLTDRQKEVMDIFLKLKDTNSHKMSPIPVFSKSESRTSNNDEYAP